MGLGNSQFIKSRPYNRYLGAFITPDRLQALSPGLHSKTEHEILSSLVSLSVVMEESTVWSDGHTSGNLYSMEGTAHPVGGSQSLTSSQSFSCLGLKPWSFWLEPFS